jgi:hypothetical protein
MKAAIRGFAAYMAAAVAATTEEGSADLAAANVAAVDTAAEGVAAVSWAASGAAAPAAAPSLLLSACCSRLLLSFSSRWVGVSCPAYECLEQLLLLLLLMKKCLCGRNLTPPPPELSPE